MPVVWSDRCPLHDPGRTGALLGGLRLPRVIVREGGYNLETIRALVLETLIAVESAL
jgi:hypothetical protein